MSEIILESREEEYFVWYLHELQQAGYIDFWKYQPKPFLLAEKAEYDFVKQLKTKDKLIIKTLLQGHQYQADFLIRWNDKAKKIFIPWINSDLNRFPFKLRDTTTAYMQSIVDVKGTFNQNDAWRRFSIDQKWVWQKYKIYVQKIIPIKLFEKSFTPARFLLTDKKTKHRKLKYVPRSLHQFINE